MDPKDQTDTVADEALSPGATEEGASSSDASDQEEVSLAETLAKDFHEEHGDAEPGAEEPDTEDDADPETDKATESEQTPEQAEVDDADDEEFRIPDDEFKALPQGVKKRIGHLNTRWKKAERELTDVKAELPTLKDTHERFTKIQNFVQENNIEPENVTKMFDMAAMLSRGDFQGFLTTIKPFYDYAAQAAGQVISPDLQEQVENGYLTEEHARELTRSRMQSQTYQAQAERYRTQAEQSRSQQTESQERGRMVEAINQRESHLQATDPDYARKKPVIESLVKMAINNGAKPRTAQQAIALLDDAYAQAGTIAPAPAPRATAPRPTSTSPGRGAAEPQSLQEAIALSLQATSAR